MNWSDLTAVGGIVIIVGFFVWLIDRITGRK